MEILKLYRKYGPLRTIAFFISVFFSIGCYHYFIDNYFPQYSLFNFSPVKKSFDFYSGSGGGLYVHIGKVLSEKTKAESWNSYEIVNKDTAGGSSNAINVLMTPRSFGLVQEETITENDFIREQLHYISPLYLERMHIVFRKDYPGQKLSLDKSLNKETKEYFKKARINTGPVGSGTRVLASYVINEIDFSGDKDSDDNRDKIFNLDSSVAFPLLDSPKPQMEIVFLVTGAPNKTVADFLEKKNSDGSYKFGLVSISPAFVAEINKKYSLNLRMSDFKGKPTDGGAPSIIYKTAKSVSTIGTYAFLISSKDISSYEHSKIINLLNDEETKNSIKKKAEIDGAGFEHFPLDEIGYGVKFKEGYIKKVILFLQSLVGFISTVSISTILFFKLFVKYMSTHIQHKYIDKIAVLQKRLKEKNVYKDDVIASEYLKSVISDSYELEDRLLEEAEHGVLSADDLGSILMSLDRIKTRARKMLSKAFLRSENEIPSKECLKELYIEGYLLENHYYQLIEKRD
ncbi:hypothetical protein [Alteromonas sp. 009811495]|uniref:hypothetical protein n=1 Tax=Alteromonas sp. 009811495 TaxID=3002962 RepID=UPI00237DD3E2|nr:hypothetical protein [Alteromonas sp. 009811495]WDT85095.1 hypothetical protein OZ660_14280 [Alteromonas sp. 009811495]